MLRDRLTCPTPSSNTAPGADLIRLWERLPDQPWLIGSAGDTHSSFQPLTLMYETFEHTADLGLRARAATLDELFADMARALTATLVEDMAAVRPRATLRLRIEGNDTALLLFDWLNELLYRFDAEGWLFADFAVRVSNDGLEAEARGEPVDTSRHRLDHEVKAITYHGLAVERTPDGWLAEVIVDI